MRWHISRASTDALSVRMLLHWMKLLRVDDQKEKFVLTVCLSGSTLRQKARLRMTAVEFEKGLLEAENKAMRAAIFEHCSYCWHCTEKGQSPRCKKCNLRNALPEFEDLLGDFNKMMKQKHKRQRGER
jgi:hypothetical protein